MEASFVWGLSVGGAAGFACMYALYRYKKGGFDRIGQEIISGAQQECAAAHSQLELELKKKEWEHTLNLEKIAEQKRQKWGQQEEKLDRQLALFEKKWLENEKKEKELCKLKATLQAAQAELTLQKDRWQTDLETLAGLSAPEARTFLLERCTQDIKSESAAFLLKVRKETEEEADRTAARLIATAVNRLALPTVSESATITVPLPSHEMKGRVIGREGRNIHTLEQATGVNFIIDDTPNAVVISGYDPVRREIARVALLELIQDGRIHPTRIEEAVALATTKVDSNIFQHGQEAAQKAGCLSFHPELTRILGKLHYRFSFGQNMLAHSLEVSQLMSLMAAELQLDVELAKRIGLLHDIGKALSHEFEGSHALIGQQVALQYGESEEVANGIGCHHDEIAPLTIEGSLCSAADRISGGRPGARSESLEHYLKRSARLEQIAKHFEGVEKAYAMHAGRELRVIIEPERFDDAMTLHLAREIAQKIEKELTFPGKIKITVIREKRAIEYAS